MSYGCYCFWCVITTFRTLTSGAVSAVPTASTVPGSARSVEGSVVRTAYRVKTFMTASGVLAGPTVTASLPRTETVVAGVPQMCAVPFSVPCMDAVAMSVPLVSEIVTVPDVLPADPPITGGVISVQSRQDLSTFMSTSVLPKTNRVYAKEWRSWKTFIKAETGSDDPYLNGVSDDEKAASVAVLMMRRHRTGKRGKAASAFTAAVRHFHAQMVMSTTFFYHCHRAGVVSDETR